MPEQNNPTTNQLTNPASPPEDLKKSSAGKSSKTKKKSKIEFRKGPLINVAILGTINLLCVLIIVLLLGILPQKAEELKNLRSLNIQNASQLDTDSLEFEILDSQTKVEKLKALFPDDTGLLEFIKEIDKLKTEGLVTNFSFTSNDPVKDKTKFSGLPIVIEFKSSWIQIDSALKRLEALPFLIRAINLEIREAGEGLIILKYGGILYVDKTFNGN